MASKARVSTALGTSVSAGRHDGVRLGRPPIVLALQTHAYIPVERPEELKQWEEDLHKFYGISVDASGMAGVACETCSCGCSDDCGLLA